MAPRSSGCRNCVKKRLKCDETRPHCERCRKARIQCSGFRDHLVFVDETRQTLDRLSPLKHGPIDTSSFLGQSPPSKSLHALELFVWQVPRFDGCLEDHYFPHLLIKFMGVGKTDDEYDGNGTWMSACLSRQEVHPVAAISLKCLATMFFGRKHHQDAISMKAAKLYGQALVALSQALQDPHRDWSFDVLAATVALNYYEYMAFTTRQGWIQHAQGTAKLIQMRGPQGFKHYPDRAILEMTRTSLITQALVARKRSFLEDKEWQILGDGSYVDPFWELDSFFAKLPGEFPPEQVSA